MTSVRTRLAGALLATAGVWLGAPLGHATTLDKPLNLADLVQHSTQIVTGTVTAVHERRMGNLPYTEIEVQVSDTLRGPASETVTLRQVGLSAARAPENGRRYAGIVPGMPQYSEGEHVLLFLGTTSAQGFRTTVGLEQGKFQRVAGGVINALDNRGLFRNVTPRARLSESETALLRTTEGAADAATFTNVIRRSIAERWWENPPATPTPGPKKATARLGRVAVQ